MCKEGGEEGGREGGEGGGEEGREWMVSKGRREIRSLKENEFFFFF